MVKFVCPECLSDEELFSVEEGEILFVGGFSEDEDGNIYWDDDKEKGSEIDYDSCTLKYYECGKCNSEFHVPTRVED